MKETQSPHFNDSSPLKHDHEFLQRKKVGSVIQGCGIEQYGCLV